MNFPDSHHVYCKTGVLDSGGSLLALSWVSTGLRIVLKRLPAPIWLEVLKLLTLVGAGIATFPPELGAVESSSESN